MVERYHKAAQDGYLDVLKETTRRDCNSKDEDGMTPTLWAAFEGNLEALRLLVGRGGDPEKCDNYGNTGLHLAAAKGHLNCVTFLVNFGVNIWDLDIDHHTAKDLAAINSKDDILKFIDCAAALQESEHPKTAKAQQEKAKKEADKRIKNFQKLQKKADKLASKEDEKMVLERRRMSLFPTADAPAAVNNQIRRSSLGGAFMGTVGRRDSQLIEQQQGTLRFSDMVGGTVNSKKMRTSVFKKAPNKPTINSEFTVRDTQVDGKKTVRNLAGLRRDSEIIFMGKDEPSCDFNENEKPNVMLSEPSSIFNRPGFGSVAFRNSITAFNSLTLTNQDDGKDDSIGSAGSLAHRNVQNERLTDVWQEEDELTDDEETGMEYTSLQMFLAATGLTDWISTFLKERIDLDALMLLTESDLGEVLGLPLGPRKKLMKAIEERKKAMEEPDTIEDSKL